MSEKITIEQIKPYEKNPKKHPDQQLRKIADSLREFGWRQPIVVDKNKEIIVGHGRYFAYKEYPQGINEPWIESAGDLSEKQVRAYRLADNKLNESNWDMELVIEELQQLDEDMIELTGFDIDILQDVKEDGFGGGGDGTPAKSKVGEIYQLGEHRLMCGDSTSRDDVEKLMSGQKARLIFTDPPYNVDYKSSSGKSYNSTAYGGDGSKIFNDNKSDKDCLAFYVDVLNNLYEFSTDDVTIYWWFANKNNHINRIAFLESGWYMSMIVIWLKDNMVFSLGQDYHRMYEPCMLGWKNKKSHYRDNRIANLKDVFSLDIHDFSELMDVWYERRDKTTEYIHPTQKPVRLAERGLKKNSEPGDIWVRVSRLFDSR